MRDYNAKHAVEDSGHCNMRPSSEQRDLRHYKLQFAVWLIAFALATVACATAPPPPDNAGALRDIAAGQAGAEVVVEGTVTRVLPASAGPSGVHERFIINVTSDGTSLPLFVADNISVGSAAPLHGGDHVIVKGELAFNSLGPVLHWTHRDPRMRHAPGFVEVGGRVYE